MISIIIPLFNKEKTIYKSIESVLAQNYTMWELIIVNDGSTDNSSEIVQKYLDDNRIKLIDKKNGGVSSARNEGLRNAQGEWILFLDADDCLIPNAFDIFVHAIAITTSRAIVANFYMGSNDNMRLYATNVKSGMKNNYIIHMILGNLSPRCGAVIFNNELLKNHFFDERLSRSEDMKFVIEVLHNEKIYYVANPVMCYNQDNLYLSKQKVFERDFVSDIRLYHYSFWERVLLSKLLVQGMKQFPEKKDILIKDNLFFQLYYFYYRLLYYISRVPVKIERIISRY